MSSENKRKPTRGQRTCTNPLVNFLHCRSLCCMRFLSGAVHCFFPLNKNRQFAFFPTDFKPKFLLENSQLQVTFCGARTYGLSPPESHHCLFHSSLVRVISTPKLYIKSVVFAEFRKKTCLLIWTLPGKHYVKLFSESLNLNLAKRLERKLTLRKSTRLLETFCQLICGYFRETRIAKLIVDFIWAKTKDVKMLNFS